MPKPITINDVLLDTELSSTLRDAIHDKQHELTRMAERLETKGAHQAVRLLGEEVLRLEQIRILLNG